MKTISVDVALDEFDDGDLIGEIVRRCGNSKHFADRLHWALRERWPLLSLAAKNGDIPEQALELISAFRRQPMADQQALERWRA